MTMANFQAAGTGSETAPAPPTHIALDLLVLFVETATEIPTTPAGWTPFPVPQVAASTITTLSTFYKFAASSAEGTPTIPGVVVNHAWGTIITFRNVNVTNPFGTILTAVSTSSVTSTAGLLPQFKTSRDDELVVYAFAWNTDSIGPMSSAEANASLANLTERYDAGTITGNGGGLIVITGEKASPGIISALTNTLVSTGYACLMFTLRPAAIHTVSGTIVVDGAPAANASNVVTIVDVTQAGEPILASVTGGAGGFTALVPYSAHTYVAIYDDGTHRGASVAAVAP